MDNLQVGAYYSKLYGIIQNNDDPHAGIRDANCNSNTLKNGMATIPNKLYQNIIENEQTTVLLNKEIVSIEKQDHNSNEFEFEPIYILKDKNGTIFKCKKLILCIPANNIQKLFENSNDFLQILTNQDKKKLMTLLNAIETNYAIKINLLFNYNNELIKNILDKYSGTKTDEPFHHLLISDTWRDGDLTTVLFYVWKHTPSQYWNKLQSMGLNDLYPNDSHLIWDIHDVKNDNDCNVQIASRLVVNQVLKQLSIVLNIDDKPMPLPLSAFISQFGNGHQFHGLCH